MPNPQLPQWAHNWPVSSRQHAHKALTTRSLRSAVTAHCMVCMGHPDTPGVRKEIRECASEDTCPLWLYRPFQKK